MYFYKIRFYSPFDYGFSKFNTPINGITYLLGTWAPKVPRGILMPGHVIQALKPQSLEN